MTSKVNFSDCFCGSIQLKSNWRSRGRDSVNSVECQTPAEFFQFSDAEVQSGRGTQIYQAQVNAKEANQSLLDYLEHNKKFKTRAEWTKFIENGYVCVETDDTDFQVCTDPNFRVHKDTIIECVDNRREIAVQTVQEESKSENSLLYSRDLSEFLQRVVPTMESELESNYGTAQAFANYQLSTSDTSQDIVLWDLLTVDLEKKKVVFPDWSSAKHSRGKIARCMLTRNKERIYDIDFDDEFKLSGVREEHIRLIEQKQAKTSKAKAASKPNLRLQEGVRVHVKVLFKGGDVKYLPGRITKVNRNGSYDVECEGNRNETGIPVEDLIVGLEEGQLVEARRPLKVELQCTGVSWNATGNTVAVAYGRNDLSGWCDFPGAVCLWPIFARGFRSDEPSFVLDHTSCLMSVCCHPVNPAIVAAGSFNGEVLVWDLTDPEHPVGVSKVSEYSHQEPVLDMQWVQAGSSRDEWLLNTVSADGKVLFWSASNGYSLPVRGYTMTANSRGTKSRRNYPMCHGVASISLSSQTTTSSSAGASATRWLLFGQEGGAVSRRQLNQLMQQSPSLTLESYKSNPAIDDVFPSLRRGDEGFAYDPHIGFVNSIACSPFHKSLFLTSGSDGSVKLFHMQEKLPLRQWDPVPPPGTLGITGAFSSLSCARFSPIRPTVFATSSVDGFVYLFDMTVSMSSPVAILEAVANPIPTRSKGFSSDGNGSSSDGNGGSNGSGAGAGSGTGSGSGGGSNSSNASRAAIAKGQNMARRAGITGIAFNHKQRDLIAGCDMKGRVHIWKLSWQLSNRGNFEQSFLDSLGSRLEST